MRECSWWKGNFDQCNILGLQEVHCCFCMNFSKELWQFLYPSEICVWLSFKNTTQTWRPTKTKSSNKAYLFQRVFMLYWKKTKEWVFISTEFCKTEKVSFLTYLSYSWCTVKDKWFLSIHNVSFGWLVGLWFWWFCLFAFLFVLVGWFSLFCGELLFVWFCFVLS